MRRKSNAYLPEYSSLEDRRLLAVVVSSSNGNLSITGDADGPIEVIATAEETFTVSDNGVELGTYPSITNNLTIDIDQTGSADNEVTVELGTEHVDNIFADLGNGNNQFDISGILTFTQAPERMVYQGGSGNDDVFFNLHTRQLLSADLGFGDDTMTVDSKGNLLQFRGGRGNDTFLQTDGLYSSNFGQASFIAGPGNDEITIDGTIFQPNIWAGAGDDTVNLGQTAVTQDTFVNMGSGNNQMNNNGWVASDLRFRGGSGSDILYFGESAFVGNNAGLLLGEGTNTVTFDGTVANGAESRLFLRSGDGNDSINFSDTLDTRGDVRMVLGDGENSLNNYGAIEGDLVAISRNIDDAFENYGDVDGRVYFNPGGQN